MHHWEQLRSLPDSSAILERVHRHFVVPGEVDLNKTGTLAAFAHLQRESSQPVSVLSLDCRIRPGGWEVKFRLV